MKSLHESILNSTHSGKKDAIIKEVEELLKVQNEKDFVYDENTGKILLWNIPDKTEISLYSWPEYIQFSSFDVYANDVKIIVNSNADYEKFKKCFDCSIGEYNARNLGKPSELKIVFTNCDVNTNDLIHKYNGKVVFRKCKVNMMAGLQSTSIFMQKCTDVQMPFGLDYLKYFNRV